VSFELSRFNVHGSCWSLPRDVFDAIQLASGQPKYAGDFALVRDGGPMTPQTQRSGEDRDS
jgi:hypothetical protein